MENTEELFGALLGASMIVIVIAVLLGLAVGIAFYYFSSKGLYELAKNEDDEHPWLAWIPVANSYLLAKIGFEKCMDKPLDYMKWIVVGLFAAGFILPSDVSSLCTWATQIIGVVALYFVFQKYRPDSKVPLTVGAVFLGSVMLFFIKNSFTKDAAVVSAKPVSNASSESKFCVNCGKTVAADSDFCENCGTKVVK